MNHIDCVRILEQVITLFLFFCASLITLLSSLSQHLRYQRWGKLRNFLVFLSFSPQISSSPHVNVVIGMEEMKREISDLL